MYHNVVYLGQKSVPAKPLCFQHPSCYLGSCFLIHVPSAIFPESGSNKRLLGEPEAGIDSQLRTVGEDRHPKGLRARYVAGASTVGSRLYLNIDDRLAGFNLRPRALENLGVVGTQQSPH